MNEFFYGYGERLKAINELFVEAVQNFIKINKQYRESFIANENAHTLYIAYIELFQKLSKQWIESLWGPLLASVQIQDK
jgi:ribosomal protein S9